MDNDKFHGQVQRLKANYGERSFSPEKIKILADFFKNRPDDQLPAIVDRLISSKNMCPTIDEIISLCPQSHKMSYSDKSYCKACQNSGWVVREDAEGRFAYPCFCSLGVKRSQYLKTCSQNA